ncbi:TIGR01621 family pseudouridine synthase [Alkalimonas delamerensis]|uniref:TIGR01621 family pseudouridine synthase n=1 Tax=Alkalimonas delamerensis TaxID=265981 RepID=A0ABT9GPQ5_9GAMM|nr:TIGR01621 family pseudouridine synthase [Alkalimonas delamerensis]MDP4528943.1 TIGR01621 family pseudouridine synthase [Alkalimonas delamerensis]
MTESIACLREHSDWLALHKAAGVSFHSESGAGFVVQAERQFDCKLYPVHRLDKMTSGILLLAKSSTAAAALAERFARQRIEKYYLALSDRKPRRKQGWVKGDMTKARRGSWKLLPTHQQPAVSYVISHGLAELGLRAFLVKPWTGKTHQIRVALKSLGSAILGDELYGGSPADRGYLHACALCFDWHGEQIRLQCWPESGQHFLAASPALPEPWSSPWQLSWPGYQQPNSDDN